MGGKNVAAPANKAKEKSIPVNGQRGITSINNLYIVFFCLVCTFVVYIHSALHNQFTNWDDNLYVAENHIITTWNSGILTARVNANWAPMHQLLLAIEYHLFGLNPEGYHLTSLLLHLYNVTLTFLVISKISKKNIVGGIVALFFGIHPMHVESVVWISAQKDLLFSAFYLSAMFTYVKFKEQANARSYPGIGYYVFTILFFLLSCLSKGMGVTLPVALVLMDCFGDNNWNWKFILKSAAKKWIFLIVAVAFGLASYAALKAGNALGLHGDQTLGEKLMFVSYGIIMYLYKFILPLSSSAIYFYPLKNAAGMYPVIYYLSPLIFAASIVLIIWIIILNKREGKSNNALFFGLLFFLINMVLVLQLKTINFVILAERYTYLSYIGLLFIVAEGVYTFWKKTPSKYKKTALAALCSVSVIFGFASNKYAGRWYDSDTLWTGVINAWQSDEVADINLIYNNRGLAYGELGMTDSAIADFTKSIALAPHPFSYNNRGLLYARLGKPDLAMADYNTTIRISPKYFAAYYNRGLLYASYGKPNLALTNYDTAISLNPDYTEAYNDRGLAYWRLGKPDIAITDYDKAINLNPRYELPYYNRGLVYASQGKYDLAIADYNAAIGLNPKYSDVYNDRGLAYAKSGKTDFAIADYNTAISLNPRFVLPYYNRGLAYEQQGKADLAIADFNMASELNPNYAEVYTDKGLIYAKQGKLDTAITYYNIAISLNPALYLPYYNRACAENLKGNHTQALADIQKATELGWQPTK